MRRRCRDLAHEHPSLPAVAVATISAPVAPSTPVARPSRPAVGQLEADRPAVRELAIGPPPRRRSDRLKVSHIGSRSPECLEKRAAVRSTVRDASASEVISVSISGGNPNLPGGVDPDADDAADRACPGVGLTQDAAATLATPWVFDDRSFGHLRRMWRAPTRSHPRGFGHRQRDDRGQLPAPIGRQHEGRKPSEQSSAAPAGASRPPAAATTRRCSSATATHTSGVPARTSRGRCRWWS